MVKRYHRPRYTWSAWDVVIRELCEQRDRLQDIDRPDNRGLSTEDRNKQQADIRLLTNLIAALRAEWTKGI